jgi:hypothetical protein
MMIFAVKKSHEVKRYKIFFENQAKGMTQISLKVFS